MRDAANWDGNWQKPGRDRKRAFRPTLAAYAPERHGDPYAGFEPRIVPENVTLLPKTTAQVTGGNAWNERTVVLKKGNPSPRPARDGRDGGRVKAITAAFGGRGKDSSPRDGYKLRVLLAPGSDGKRLRPVRVIIATDTNIEAMVAWSEMGKYVAVDVRSANSVASSATTRGRRQGRAALSEHLRDRATQPRAPPGDRRSHPHLFLRRRLPAQGSARQFLRDPVRRRGREPATTARPSLVRFADHRRGDEEVLPLPDHRRQHRRLLRRDRQEREEVPGPQAGLRRRHHVRLRRPQPSPARLQQDAYRRGLGLLDGHGGLRRGQRHHRQGGWEGGYGKYIRIRHANGYETAYGHMSAFARGMEPARRSARDR